ncbi:IS3 family transposase [Marinifaba aquimaris]|uniref:IS3 family transposase n=1 Tax=Marinifaba aquimaris TaxID=2741323 RepID=UPI0031B57EFC
MQQFVGQFRITIMCKAMKVARSGYYQCIHRKPSDKAKRHTLLQQAIVSMFEHYKARYGAPRLTRALKSNDIPCCVNTVAEVMKSQGLRARNGRAFRYSRFSYANLNVADNVLKREFKACLPNTKWVPDITYIRFKGQWLYLATVMDLFSRAIVGWSLDTSMTEELITKALKMAIERREVNDGLIIHSD